MGSILPSLSSLGTLPSFSQIESEVTQAGGNGSPFELPKTIDLSPGALPPSQQDVMNKDIASSPSWSNVLSGFSTGRIATFIIGIVCITIGLLMFKTTQTVIQTAGRVAASAA